MVDELKRYLDDIKALSRRAEKKRDVLDCVLLFGEGKVYSAQRGRLQRRFADADAADAENFVYFPDADFDVSAAFDTQVDLLEHVLVVFHQMYLCFCNHRKQRPAIPGEGRRDARCAANLRHNFAF